MAFAGGRTDFSQRLQRVMRSPLFFAVAGLWLLLLGMELARPCFFLQDDNATWFIGAYAHDYRVLTETGRVAEVNYFQYGGEPFLEQGQTAVLYPPVYIGVALAKWISGDVRWSIEWIAAMHLTLGLLGFYFWLRAGGVSAGLAALGGLAWVLNPFVLLVASSWIMVTYVAAWLPWLFWAMDRLLARPSRLAAVWLGAIAGLFFLQGYVQWVVYSFLFLGLYGGFGFFTRREQASSIRRGAVIYYLIVAVVIFLILALPLFLPMSHAADVSVARARPMEFGHALFFRVTRHDLWRAQLCLFTPQFVFGISSAMLYCPALLFLPVMMVRFFRADAAIRQKLFPLVLLALLAIFLSSRWHLLLTLLPIADKFRWPFKMFLLADFFLVAALIWSVFSWGSERKWLATTCAVVVLGAGLAIALGFHDGNFFSRAILPTSQLPLPASVNPGLGRVIAIDDVPPDEESYRFLSAGHATLFEVPSLGGYNPLVSPARLRFGLGLDFPNVYRGPITPGFRAALQERSVRYWIVDPRSPQFGQLWKVGGFNAWSGFESINRFRILSQEPDRMVLEDTLATPLAFAASDPATPLALSYAGNSLHVALEHATSPVEISAEATDGWWYRVDGGPWVRPAYQDDRLKVEFAPGSRVAEVSYFDPRFREGLGWSAGLVVVLGVLMAGSWFVTGRRET